MMHVRLMIGLATPQNVGTVHGRSYWVGPRLNSSKAYLTGNEKPIPSVPRNIAVLTPITWPSRVTNGPPLLPGLIGASVCKYIPHAALPALLVQMLLPNARIGISDN